MKYVWLPALVLLLAGVWIVQQGGSEGYRRVSMQEAAALMEEGGDYLLLDVRTEAEYASGHIPGAVCVPNETIGQEPPAALPELDQTILIYCRSGNRSRQAAEKLAALGYTHLIEIGGINDWDGPLNEGMTP